MLLYHGLRRAELSAIDVGDLQERRGVKHLRIHGKGNKLRYLPLHPAAAARVELAKSLPALAEKGFRFELAQVE